MKKLINAIKEFFRFKCENCNGTLEYEFYDDRIDLPVYKCDTCGQQWI